MPFTISHAAAIIPFNRRPFVLSALITGCMSPDFLYFIPGIPNYRITHTIPGLFLFCLPASLVAFHLYHHWLKQPLISLLPGPVRRRLPNNLHRFTPYWPWLIASILMGAFTHIFWDSFTHSYGLAVRLMPGLTQPVLTVFGETLLLYKLLQYLSTILGGLIVITWAARWLWQQPFRNIPSTAASPSLTLPLMALLSSLCGFLYGGFQYSAGGVKVFVVQAVIVTMSTFFALLGLYSADWHRRHYRRRQDPSG